MDEQAISTPKKTTRTRKTMEVSSPTPSSVASSSDITQVFDNLMNSIIVNRQEFDNLQKEIAQVKQDWAREQKQHQLELIQQRMQEDLERKREQETYQYEAILTRKRVEDEFNDKKSAWEKDLSQRKQEIEDQRKELEELRKLVSAFDGQKEAAVKEAQTKLQKELSDNYDQERKLKEAEEKASKDLLNMRIVTLETDNSRLNKELELLKRSLDESTRQVKEIAVKVIESGQPKTQTPDKITP